MDDGFLQKGDGLMANVVENMPENGRGRGRGEKYPWSTWLDGRIWRLVRGEDYACASRSMVATSWCAARRFGLDLKTVVHTDGKSVYIQAVKRR